MRSSIATPDNRGPPCVCVFCVFFFCSLSSYVNMYGMGNRIVLDHFYMHVVWWARSHMCTKTDRPVRPVQSELNTKRRNRGRPLAQWHALHSHRSMELTHPGIWDISGIVCAWTCGPLVRSYCGSPSTSAWQTLRCSIVFIICRTHHGSITCIQCTNDFKL